MGNFTFDELSILTAYHLKFYRQHLKRQAFLHHEGWMVSESSHPIPFELAYAYSIQSALEQLTEDEKRILVYEYVENKPKNWWMEYFSKTTYYRIKHHALDQFIHCLHDEKVV